MSDPAVDPAAASAAATANVTAKLDKKKSIILGVIGLAVIVLRTSRFFPEDDDDAAVRSRYETANVQANELLYRRLDIADAVDAHLLALQRAAAIGFGRYIVSATTPFTPTDLAMLRHDAPAVLRRLYPHYEALYAARGWRMFGGLDRVYDNRRAREALGWQPRHDFAQVLRALEQQRDFRSELALQIGSDRDPADAALQRLLDADGQAKDDAFAIARVYALRNDADKAIAWLQRDRERGGNGVLNALADPLILRLRNDPRLAAYCRQAGLPAPDASEALSLDQIRAKLALQR